MRIRTIALLGLAGAAAAYLLDPMSGRVRRQRLRQRLMPTARLGTIFEGPRAPLPDNVAPSAPPAGPAHREEPAHEPIPLGPGFPMDDAGIAARIRTEVFGRDDLDTDKLTVDVVSGVAFLRGELKDGHAIEEIVDRTRVVVGVRAVHNLIVVRMPESVTLTRPVRTLGDAWSG